MWRQFLRYAYFPAGSDYNAFKAGKVSDADSGIASPLSPGSVYGFLGYTDKEYNGCWKKNSLEIDFKHRALPATECCCADERSQVSGYLFRTIFSSTEIRNMIWIDLYGTNRNYAVLLSKALLFLEPVHIFPYLRHYPNSSHPSF